MTPDRRYRLERPSASRRWGNWVRVSWHRTLEQGLDAYRILSRFEPLRLVDRATGEVVEPKS